MPTPSLRPLRSLTLAAILGVADRKSTRLNSSHLVISYAVFCLKKTNDVAHRIRAPHAHSLVESPEDGNRLAHPVLRTHVHPTRPPHPPPHPFRDPCVLDSQYDG